MTGRSRVVGLFLSRDYCTYTEIEVNWDMLGVGYIYVGRPGGGGAVLCVSRGCAEATHLDLTNMGGNIF